MKSNTYVNTITGVHFDVNKRQEDHLLNLMRMEREKDKLFIRTIKVNVKKRWPDMYDALIKKVPKVHKKIVSLADFEKTTIASNISVDNERDV